MKIKVIGVSKKIKKNIILDNIQKKYIIYLKKNRYRSWL